MKNEKRCIWECIQRFCAYVTIFWLVEDRIYPEGISQCIQLQNDKVTKLSLSLSRPRNFHRV